MKRIISSSLAIIMLLVMLVSCAESEESLTFKTNIKQMFPYTINIKYNYIVEDEELEGVLDGLEVSGKYVFDGESYMHTTSVAGSETEVIVLKDTVYSKKNNKLQKATFDEKDSEKVIEDAGVEIFGSEMFNSVELTKNKDVYTLTCTGISKEGEKFLKDNSYMGVSNNAQWSDVSHVEVYEGGVLSSETTRIPIVFSQMGVTVKYTMEIVYTYDYESKVEKIKAPENAEKYEECKLEEIFG